MTGYFKILPMFLMIIPGMISRSLWPDLVACVDPDTCERVCGNPAGCSDIAYPRMVVQLMPTGLRGLMLATMLAAMISSLTSIFNASSSMFVLDIWYKIRPRSTELELVIVGKFSTVVMVVVGVLWIPILQAYGSGELFTYIQAINSYLTPGVFSVFTAAILFQRVNETGAFWGLVCGFVIGLIRAVLDFVYGVPSCGQEDNRPAMIKDFHYLHFAAFVYGLTLILVIGFSFLTDPVPPYKLVRLTWWNHLSGLPRVPISSSEEEKRLKNELIREEKQKQAAINAQTRTGLKWKLWYILCCISTSTPEIDDGDEPGGDHDSVDKGKEAGVDQKASAYENPTWARFALVNGILLGGACAFILAYYG